MLPTTPSRARTVLLLALAALALQDVVRARSAPPLAAARGEACATAWLPTFGGQPGADDIVFAVAELDDGSGPAPYVAGRFHHAGGVPATGIARWDGSTWSAVGGGVAGGLFPAVLCLAVHDDGNGPALYAGGLFSEAGGVAASGVARWDGTSWSRLGSGLSGGPNGGAVHALAVYDEGNGPALFAAGSFTVAGGVAVQGIARWDGASWSDVSGGLDDQVNALAVHDDGTGPALYAGGRFAAAGGVPARRIARWDGASWSQPGSGVGPGVQVEVGSLAVYDDGGGPDLYAGGSFTSVGGVAASGVARWDGSAWSALGGGVSSSAGHFVLALSVYDDGAGPELYAGGFFGNAGGVPVNSIAKWNGSSWSSLGAGAIGNPIDYGVRALAVADDGSGPALFVGGEFDLAGGPHAQSVPANRIARWRGSSWSALGKGLNDAVHALAVFDGGGGPELHAAGRFTAVDGATTRSIARWDGSTWSQLGSGIVVSGGTGSVHALLAHDDGSGSALYAGGLFQQAGAIPASNVARWNGSVWSSVGSGTLGRVLALEEYDDGNGPALHAGGSFTVAGGVAASRIARWDGSAWSPLGTGVAGGVGGLADVLALAAFDDGGGPALFAGGNFTIAGGAPASHVARWDGSSWAPLGAGVGGALSGVLALEVFDDGNGPALYAGGDFTTAGGAPASRIARWDGTSWSAVGGGLDDVVLTLAVHDDGGGPALHAGGRFTTAGGVPASRIARWDGAAWSALGGGTSDAVVALVAHDAGSGRELFAGGSFGSALDSGDSYLARWGCSAGSPPTTYCAGKTSSVGCVPFLAFTGTPSASSPAAFAIRAEDVVPSEPGFLVYGFRKADLDFHGGKLCVKPPFVRTAAKTPKNPGGGCSGWILSRDFNRTIQGGSDPALTAGATAFAQWRQRDPADPQGFGDALTDGIRFGIAP